MYLTPFLVEILRFFHKSLLKFCFKGIGGGGTGLGLRISLFYHMLNLYVGVISFYRIEKSSTVSEIWLRESVTYGPVFGHLHGKMTQKKSMFRMPFFSINGPKGLIFGQWVHKGNILKITEGIRDFFIFCGHRTLYWAYRFNLVEGLKISFVMGRVWDEEWAPLTQPLVCLPVIWFDLWSISFLFLQFPATFIQMNFFNYQWWKYMHICLVQCYLVFQNPPITILWQSMW